MPLSSFSDLLKILPPDAYVVGGAVRDRLLGRKTADLDVVVSDDPLPWAERLARMAGGRAFALDADRGIQRVTLARGLHLDLARRQGKSFEDDIDRRDFTINALAVPVRSWITDRWRKAIVDRHHGQRDLAAQRVECVSSGIFKDDPLRLLRAFRLSSELDFNFSPALVRAVTRERKKIRRSAPERIREELLRIFSTPRAYNALVRMERAGLLDVLFPEARALRRTAPTYYGRGGVLKHTLDSVHFFEEIQSSLAAWFPRSHRKVATYLSEPLSGYPRSAHCKWALVLHDIGKPATAQRIKGRLRFFEHERVGAELVEKIAKRFRWSSDETQRYARLVRHHMRPGNLATHESVSDKAIHRFFRDLGDDGVAMLLVSLADHLTYLTSAQRKKRSSPHERITLRMIQRYYHQRRRVVPPKIVTGHDLMKAFRLSPSPLIGRLLADVAEAQSEGKIKTTDHALIYLKGRLAWHQQQLSEKTPGAS